MGQIAGQRRDQIFRRCRNRRTDLFGKDELNCQLANQIARQRAYKAARQMVKPVEGDLS
jgi:hypothetical protein